MIFMTSKRVFLNVLCAYMTKEQILNANYYIADCLSPDTPGMNTQYFNYDENGNLYEEKPNNVLTTSIYNVRYGNNCLNPSPYITTFLTNNRGESNVIERWCDTLMQYSTMADVQEQIYLPIRRGNGMLFIIYNRDENIINFGGMIASYLAENFGEDITFVDPKYRPYVKGQYMYKGNLINARKVGKNLNEARILFSFLQTAETACGIEEGVSNMNVYLQAFNMVDLINLYNLLWPNDPLPQANYSISQLKEIIIGRMVDSGKVGASFNQNRLNIIESYDPENY